MSGGSRRGQVLAEALSFDAEAEALLREAGLPVSDLAKGGNVTLLGVHDAGRLIGVIGVEQHGHVALLRSLVVASTHQNHGLGAGLVASAEAWSVQRKIRALYLLTTTAAGFFARLGYSPVPRSAAPLTIADTAQFKELCPASSTLMRKVLVARELQPERTA